MGLSIRLAWGPWSSEDSEGGRSVRMLSGLTLPEDNLDHRGEKPRRVGHLAGRGEVFLPTRHIWKTKCYQPAKEEPLGEIWGGNQGQREWSSAGSVSPPRQASHTNTAQEAPRPQQDERSRARSQILQKLPEPSTPKKATKRKDIRPMSPPTERSISLGDASRPWQTNFFPLFSTLKSLKRQQASG